MPMEMNIDLKNLRATVTLPSRGFPYGDKLPGGQVTVRSMTTRDEKILSGQSGDPDTKICTILSNCSELNGVPIGDLLISDKFYLLMALRVVSFGGDYEFQYTCENQACKNKFVHSVNIASFPVVMWDKFEEPFFVMLPHKGDKLTCKFLRSRDEASVTKEADAAPRKAKEIGDAAYIPRIAKFITAVNDKTMAQAELLAYVEALPSRDSQALRRSIEKASCGIDPEIEIECPKCAGKETVNLPFTVDFFRASEGDV